MRSVQTTPLDYVSPSKPPRAWRRLAGRFSLWHVWIALALLLAFVGLTFSAARAYPTRLAATIMVGIALGPMAGAFVRDYQGCCLEFSLSLLPYCAGALVGALAVQLLVPPKTGLLRAFRLLTWAAGLFIWFAGALVSYMHALS